MKQPNSYQSVLKKVTEDFEKTFTENKDEKEPDKSINDRLR